MAAPVAAIDYLTMLQNCYPNIHSLAESAVNLKARLAIWKSGFFPLLDKAILSESKIHQWVIPTNILQQQLADVQVWDEVEDVFAVILSTIVATRLNGYTPTSPTFEADMVAAFNAAWT